VEPILRYPLDGDAHNVGTLGAAYDVAPDPLPTHGPEGLVRITRNVGLLLAGIWLLLTGLFPLLKFSLRGVVMALLAVVAGIFLIIDR
jgi:hypothetical protein